MAQLSPVYYIKNVGLYGATFSSLLYKKTLAFMAQLSPDYYIKKRWPLWRNFLQIII
jgi:hypothetical protein